MYRDRVLLMGVALAVLGTVVPLVVIGYLSWRAGVAREQALLQIYADRTVQRTREAVQEAQVALLTANASAYLPCSARHIDALRMATINTRSVEDIGYFGPDDRLVCTSWGVRSEQVARTAIDFRTANGFGVTARMYPNIAGTSPMMAIHDGAYTALINPQRLVDVLVDQDVQLAIAASDGKPLASTGTLAASFLRSDNAHLKDGGLQHRQLFARASGDGWRAVAVRPLGSVSAQLYRQQLRLLPFALLVAAAVVLLSIRLIRQRLSPLAELRRAVRQHEFVVHYQPIVHLASGRCVGAEALVRWQRDGRLVAPDAFIPLAEESGLILPITDQVIAAVVREMGATLLAEPDLHVAINLAPEDLHSGRFLPVLDAALAGARIPARQIWLEATERGFLQVEAASAVLATARARGHEVAIDDFGTGYSSLRHLQSLPLDALKIDKSFIETVGTDAATSLVTEHIVEMAKSLALATVAEGVETQEQVDYLKARGVEQGQGWFFAKPLPAAEFIAFHRRTQQLSDGRAASATTPGP